MLDDAELPVGVVEAIAGQTRASVTFTGAAAHAGHHADGRAPRRARRGGGVDRRGRGRRGARRTAGLVADGRRSSTSTRARRTSSRAGSWRSLDVRHADDGAREDAVRALRERAAAAGAARGVEVGWEDVQATPAVRCDPDAHRPPGGHRGGGHRRRASRAWRAAPATTR